MKLRSATRVRGAVIVETAFVMSVVLMVLFGAVQLSVLAFTQTSQDGAAFVAARAYAEYASGGTSSASGAANKIFTHVPAASMTFAPTPGQVAVTITGTSHGLPVPASPATFAVGSVASELIATANSGTPFVANVTLTNFYSTPGEVGWWTWWQFFHNPYGIYEPEPIQVAQTFGTGSGSKYGEWYCRQSVYANLNLPSTTSNAAIWCQIDFFFNFNCFFDPAQNASSLNQIYNWDTGDTCV